MSITIDEQNAEAKSRLVLVSLVTLTLRLMERWRQAIADGLKIDPDYDTIMILAAIIAINAEKLMRLPIDPRLQNLKTPFEADLLTKCNVSSLAAATGLNRETTRRKIKQLQQAGIVTREGRSFRIAGPLFQLPVLRESVRAQLGTLRRATNELLRLSVVRTGE